MISAAKLDSHLTVSRPATDEARRSDSQIPAKRADPTAPSRRTWTLAAASLALFLVFLDNTVVNVALPSIQHSLAASTDALEWSVNAYVVAFAGLIMLGGELGDRVGRKRMFVLGLAVFGAASLTAAIAGSAGELIAARAFQGAGAALLAPLSLSLLASAFPREQLSSAVGVWAGVSGLGLAIGPLLGGVLVDNYGWHAIFWINLPLVALGLLITVVGVGESRDPDARRLDPLGTVLISLGLSALVSGLIRTTLHTWASPLTLVLVGGGLALLVAFVVQQRRTREPLIPPALLRQREFRGAVVVLGLSTFALFGTLWFLTLYLQDVRGYTPISAGVRMLPLTVMTLLIAPVAGRAMGKLGARALAVAGLLLAGGALAGLTMLSAHTEYIQLGLTLAALGAGLALALPVAAAVAISNADPDRVGIGAGVATMARQLGGAIGLAVLVPIGARIAASDFGDPAPAALINLVKGGEARVAARVFGPHAGTEAANAFVSGMTHSLWLGVAAVGVALLAASSLPAAPARRTPRLPRDSRKRGGSC